MPLSSNLITLTAQGELAQGKGQARENPLGNAFILDQDEIVNVKTVISQYNNIIKTAAEAKGFGYVDAAAFFNNILAAYVTSGAYVVDGIKFTPVFVTGSLFSLDGVHPTNQAYGLIANEFIKVINENTMRRYLL